MVEQFENIDLSFFLQNFGCFSLSVVLSFLYSVILLKLTLLTSAKLYMISSHHITKEATKVPELPLKVLKTSLPYIYIAPNCQMCVLNVSPYTVKAIRANCKYWATTYKGPSHWLFTIAF